MDIFLSYRRDGGIELTRSLKMKLKKKGYTVFFDNDSIGSGLFPERIANCINNSYNVVIILSPHAWDRCLDEEDWVRKEVEQAVREGKNIIPVFFNEFTPPPNLPDRLKKALEFNGVHYDPKLFDTMVDQLIELLRDENGKSLKVAKKKNVSNFFYSDGVSPEERKRIAQDYEAVKKIETGIWDSLLEGKSDLTLFAPAVYDAKTYIKKYDRPEFSHVFGMVNTEEECADANAHYSLDGKAGYYVGNMENDDFVDVMDQIISDNDIDGFDFADLTLILRDCKNPAKKLDQLVERMNSGGIVYVREFDHASAMAYPDNGGRFKHMFELIDYDKYSGDFYAGRKVYSQMHEACLENIALVDSCITNIGLNRRERSTLFDALFSYVPREYESLLKENPGDKIYEDAVAWLQENYNAMRLEFISDHLFYRSGHMFFYGFV